MEERIITTPVTEPNQIQSLLGYSGITDYAKIFKLPTIKVWAKYKPFRANIIGVATEEQRKMKGYGTTVKEECVYDVSVNDSLPVYERMLNDSITGVTGWIHEPPRGLIEGEWYRGHDWVGYNHDAIPPFYFEDASVAGELKIRVGQIAQLPTNNMSVTDITSVIGMTNPEMAGYGFIIRKADRVIVIDAINDKGVAAYPLTQDHELKLLEGSGTFEVCAYIMDDNRSGVAWLLPTESLTINVSTPPPVVVIVAEFANQSSTKPTFSFTITGNSETPLPAGTAILRMFDTNGKEFELWNFDIPILTMGQTHSDTIMLELDRVVDHWTFTYKRVTIDD